MSQRGDISAGTDSDRGRRDNSDDPEGNDVALRVGHDRRVSSQPTFGMFRHSLTRSAARQSLGIQLSDFEAQRIAGDIALCRAYYANWLRQQDGAPSPLAEGWAPLSSPRTRPAPDGPPSDRPAAAPVEEVSRPMPGPLRVLYGIAVGVAVVAFFALVNAASEGFATPVFIGYMIGCAIGAFIPPLVAHAIVMAVREGNESRT